jgi:hypothetical protein
MKHKGFLSVLWVALILGLMPSVYAQDGGDVNVIEYGNTEFGTLSTSSPSEAWQFEGYAADLITVSVNQIMGELDPYVVLLDPTGRVLAVDDNSGDQYPNARINGLRLPDSGTYTILAQAYRDTTGDYEVILVRDEPGMIYGQAGGGGPIPYDIPMIDGLSQQSSSDKWTFEGLPGDVVSLTMKRLSGTLVPYLLIVDPRGTVIAATNYASGDVTTLDQVALTAAGTYTVIAQCAPDSYTAGDYELRLTRIAEGFMPLAEGGGTIQYGDEAAGALWAEHPTDEYTFEGVPGETIQIAVNRVDGNLVPGVTLFDPAGNNIAVNDTNSDDAIYETSAYLQTAGQYTLAINRGYSSIGNYQLVLELVSPGITHAPGGGALEYGQSAEGAIWPENPADDYTFEAKPGDEIEIEVVRQNGDSDLSIRLVGPDKQSISIYDDDGRNEVYRAKTILSQIGTYRIRVTSSYSASQAGDYEISLTLVKPGISHAAGGGDLAYNTVVQAALWNENLRDDWSFDAQAGDTVNILVTPTSGDLDPYLRLFGPDSQLLSYNGSNITEYSLMMTGKYTVVVSLERGAYGDYDLVVEHIQSLVTPTDGGVLPLGERVISAISSENLIDTWTFDGQQGDRAVMGMSLISGSLNPFLVLLKPDGTVLALNDDFNYNNTMAGIDVNLPITGTYQLLAQASPINLYGLGNYAVMVSIVQTADGRVLPSGGGQILLGETVTGGITNENPQDVYRITITDPVVIDIALTRTDGNLNGYLEVQNDKGEVVISDDDSAGGFNPMIKALTLEPGEYTIVAQRPDTDKLSEGVYELSVTRAE